MTSTPDRDAHRQALRDQADHLLVVLPYDDGDVGHVLGQLEELLLAVGDTDLDGQPLPAPFAGREACDAVGRLASYVAAMQGDDPPTQPLGADGRHELVPLLFVILGRQDRAHILGAVTQLAAATSTGRGQLYELLDWSGDDQAHAVAVVATAQRLAALLETPSDDDTDVLNARLGRLCLNGPTERIVLNAGELAAYERVTDRILATWHGNDPLERFVYRGGLSPGEPPAVA